MNQTNVCDTHNHFVSTAALKSAAILSSVRPQRLLSQLLGPLLAL
jgi:hypothetical protein